MMKILLKNGQVVAGDRIVPADLLIEDGKIAQIAANIVCNDAQIVDVVGKTVMPGFVDIHCHLREPGFEYKETIATGTRAAAMGGFTSVACMANTQPVADSAAIIKFIKLQAEKEGVVHVYPIGAISKGLDGKELAEIGELVAAGTPEQVAKNKASYTGHYLKKVLR